VEIEVTHETELLRCVVRPVRVALGNGNAVVEVQHQFHAEECEEEADSIFGGSRTFDGRGGVLRLRDVVVEGEDWTGEVERGVNGVGEVVAEVVVCSCGGSTDTVVFGEVGRVELFLLRTISGDCQGRKGICTSRGLPARRSSDQ